MDDSTNAPSQPPESAPLPAAQSPQTPSTSQPAPPSPTSSTTPHSKSSKHPHDATGRFTSKGANISGFLATETTDDDTTLVDVKLHNPFHKITQILEQIRAHQSTTVSLRFTIPLIALPIVLLAAFQLGRVQTLCSPVFSSEIGNLQLVSLDVPQGENAWYSQFANLLPGNFIPQKTVGFRHENRAILVTQDGSTLTLLPANEIKLDTFNNARVIVSGNYSYCNKAITVDSPSNIQQMQ